MATTTESSAPEGYEGTLSDIEQPFKALSTDEQLAVLWQVYEGLGESRIEDPDDNKESDSSSDLYNQLAEKSEDDQLNFMRSVLSGESNDQTSAYSQLSNTTKIALWYRLADGMAKGSVVQVPGDYQLSDQAQQVVSKVNEIDFEQKYILIRDALLGGQS